MPGFISIPELLKVDHVATPLRKGVHPTFDGWKFDAAIDYVSIAPALRLASRMLGVKEMYPMRTQVFLGRSQKR